MFDADVAIGCDQRDPDTFNPLESLHSEDRRVAVPVDSLDAAPAMRCEPFRRDVDVVVHVPLVRCWRF